MLEALVTADWHLEAMAKHFPEDHIERQLETIERIYQYAVEHGINTIIVPGDITDSYRMSDDTKEKLLAHFRKYEGIIDTHYCGGNHDRADEKKTSMDLINQFTKWSFLKSLHVYMTPTQIELEGIVVNFLPHPAKKSIKNKRPCLNFCHVEAVGALGDNGRPLHAKKDIAVDPRDYTFSGHIHLHQILEAKRFTYCGSPYQKTFGEGLPKGFMHIRVQYKKKQLVVKQKFIDSKPGFRLETVVVADQKDWSKLEVNKAIRYRVIVREGVSIPADIRIRVPNISQLNTSNKKVDLDNIDHIDVSELELAEINPKDGLKDYLKEAGLDKALRKRAEKEIDAVLSEIGYASA